MFCGTFDSLVAVLHVRPLPVSVADSYSSASHVAGAVFLSRFCCSAALNFTPLLYPSLAPARARLCPVTACPSAAALVVLSIPRCRVGLCRPGFDLASLPPSSSVFLSRLPSLSPVFVCSRGLGRLWVPYPWFGPFVLSPFLVRLVVFLVSWVRPAPPRSSVSAPAGGCSLFFLLTFSFFAAVAPPALCLGPVLLLHHSTPVLALLLCPSTLTPSRAYRRRPSGITVLCPHCTSLSPHSALIPACLPSFRAGPHASFAYGAFSALPFGSFHVSESGLLNACFIAL